MSEKQLKGTNVASPIVPFSSEDTYPTHEAKYGKGGFRTVETIAERDAIPEARREEGMLVYVVNDPENINTYQYLNSTWQKSKIGAGVEKVQTIEEREALKSEIGDLVYVGSEGQVFIKLSEDDWRPMSFGIPIFTKEIEDKLEDIDKLPDDYITIPDPGELSQTTDKTEYESTGNGYYLDIIFSTLRSLQAEVAKLRNSFNYGMYSYTGKETAMSRVVGSYTAPEEEPLWAVEEADLSIVTGVYVDLNDNNSLVPSENVKIGDNYLIINGAASWYDPPTGYAEVSDPKLFLYLTTSSTNIQIVFSKISDSASRITLDLSQLGLKQYENGRYNIMICLARKVADAGEYYGENYVWVSVGNYTTGENENMGYWNTTTNKLQPGIFRIDDRYSFYSVTFNDQNLYKFGGYSKYQDFSIQVDPVTPTDDKYKYRVAHITIRSVKNEAELQDIKDQLPANELIYNETTGVLWIKTSSGSVRPISGSGGQDDKGMEKSEIIEWLAQNGIIVTSDGSESVKLNDIADITFIHQETDRAFKFTVDSEGNLVSEEIPSTTIEDRMRAANFTLSTETVNFTNIRGLVGSLGLQEQHTENPSSQIAENKDIGLYADRVKISAIYAPYSQDQPSYGCSHAYIELENTGNKDLPLDGFYLHYATGTCATESTGTDFVSVYRLALHGAIPAGGTYLIRGKKYADYDQANTFIKVRTFDQEWFVNGDLIDLTQNQNNTFLLTYGLPDVSYSTVLVKTNQDTKTNTNFPYYYHPNYVDSVSIGAHVTSKAANAWVGTGMKLFDPKCGVYDSPVDVIFKNTFELDPAKQAYQSLNKTDSSRGRNENVQDYQYVLLSKDVIEFPKTEETFPIEHYTPMASWQHKNVCTDKTKLDKEKPNMVTASYGIDMYKTRCFNWISCGAFDEYIWIRPQGSSSWSARFESYKDGTENDYVGTSGMTKRVFGTFHNKTVGDENYPIQKVIYNRMFGTFPADGTKYTSHKCIINVVPQAAETGKTVYEYVVGRADKNMNPDPEHTSAVQTFTLYSKEYTPRIFQTTDQQGFHWVEYQCWAAAAVELNKTINSIVESEKIMPVLMNTGDMTQNGTRINEWFDYYNAGHCLFDHLEQTNLVGNNDLCNTDPEMLGTGDDNGKSNGYYFHVFYCYEIDESILPIISNIDATKYVPSLYYIQDKSYRFVMLNTEITAINCRNWFKQVKNDANGNPATVNVYTGWTIKNSGAADNSVVYDNSFKTIYTMIYEMLDAPDYNIIPACHEMPFTVVTNANLMTVSSGSVGNQDIDRSLKESQSGSLVGCHCNRMGYMDVKGIYWLSRLFEHFGIKLCIGGHKHTYACTNPLREFYYYTSGDQLVSSLNGPMTMANTLENDTAVWVTNIYVDPSNPNHFGIDYTTGDSLEFNTTKFPLMSSSVSGITRTSAVYYPYYGVPSLTGGVVYFMCQATGYKLKSNKELPSPEQRFSYVIPKTNVTSSGDKPNANQQRPMFAEIKLNGSNSYTIYLYRIENIMNGTNLFSQVDHSNAPASYRWLKGNEAQGTELPIYGNWNYTTKTALIEI